MTHTDILHDIPPFGTRLRAARESRKLSLEDIGSRLRLNPDIIHFLESGNFQSTPPAIFMRGYLRSYARLLDFNDSDIQNALTAAGLKNGTDTPLMPRTQNSPERTQMAPWLYWVSVALVITLAFIVFVWWNAYPVTLVREKLSAHLSSPLASAAPLSMAIRTEIEPTADATPALPEAPLILPSGLGVLSDAGIASPEPAESDPS